jgi:hypothetical protein
MAKSEFVAVRCKLSKSLFSSERAFEVTLANGEKYSGPAPIYFCWNKDGELLRANEVTEGEVDGWVAARPLEYPLEGDQVAVEVPDGEALAVQKSEVRDAWTEIAPPTRATA